MRFLLGLACLISFASLSSAYALQCDSPKTDREIANCLGIELIDSDKKINEIYRTLMTSRTDEQKRELRLAQREWLKERDRACRLDAREHDRDKWLAAILQDYAKTTCVVRFTRGRIGELEQMQSNSVGPPPVPRSSPEASGNEPTAGIKYRHRNPNLHSSGKWYFELTVNFAEVVKIAPMVLSVGIRNDAIFSGTIFNIRTRDADLDPVRIGIAADLDNGKLYISRNGTWTNGEPGSNLGMDLKLGREYAAVFVTSADNTLPYLLHKAVIPNFGGEQPMAYVLPAGYSPWRNQKLD